MSCLSLTSDPTAQFSGRAKWICNKELHCSLILKMDVDINTALIILHLQNCIWASKATSGLWKPCTQCVEPDVTPDFAERAWVGLKALKTTLILSKWRIPWLGWDRESSPCCVIPQTFSRRAPLKDRINPKYSSLEHRSTGGVFIVEYGKNQRFSWHLLLLNQSSNNLLYKGNTDDFRYGFNFQMPLSFKHLLQ